MFVTDWCITNHVACVWWTDWTWWTCRPTKWSRTALRKCAAKGTPGVKTRKVRAFLCLFSSFRSFRLFVCSVALFPARSRCDGAFLLNTVDTNRSSLYSACIVHACPPKGSRKDVWFPPNPRSGISGLSFDSPVLSPLLFFCASPLALSVLTLFFFFLFFFFFS